MTQKSLGRLIPILGILAVCIIGLPLTTLFNSCSSTPKGVEITQTAKVQTHDYNTYCFSYGTLTDDYFAPYELETIYKNNGEIVCVTHKYGTFKKLDSLKCIEYDYIKKVGDSIVKQQAKVKEELEILNKPCGGS